VPEVEYGHRGELRAADVRMRNSEALWSQSAPYRTIIGALEERLKVLDDMAKQCKLLTKKEHSHQVEKAGLREMLQSAKDSFAKRVEELSHLNERLVAENKTLHTQLTEKTRLLKAQEAETDELRRGLGSREAESQAVVAHLQGQIKDATATINSMALDKEGQEVHASQRAELHRHYTAAIEQFRSQVEELNRHRAILEEENQQTKQQLQDCESRYEDLQAEMDRRVESVRGERWSLLEAERTARLADGCEIEYLKQQLQREAKGTQDTKQAMASQHEELQSALNTALQKRKALEQAHEELQTQSTAALKERDQLKTQVQQGTVEKHQLAAQILSLEQKLKIDEADGLAERLAQAQHEAHTAQQARAHMQDQLRVMEEHASRAAEEHRSVVAGMQHRQQELETNIQEMRRTVASKDELLESGELKRAELTDIIVKMDAKVAHLSDVEGHLSTTRDLLSQKDQQMDTMRGDYYQACEDLRLGSIKWDEDRGQLLSALEERTCEVRHLTNRLNVITTKYIPVKNDPIDALLAERVREHPPPVPFCRREQGTYLFGTKTCVATIQNDAIVFRVGGGYLPYDAFVSRYGQEEADKLQPCGPMLDDY